jgi:hypothetical protein
MALSSLSNALSLLLLSSLSLGPSFVSAAIAGVSTKRGLSFVPNAKWPQDNYIWPHQPTDLTWYYNYQDRPSVAFNNVSQAAFEFVPMMWGAPTDISDTTFLNNIKSLITDQGVNISHVLSFNEPDGPSQYGGSNIQPNVAAHVWVNNIMPLKELGIRLGLPAVMYGPAWLKQFLGNCSEIISTNGEPKNCTYDFVPVHSYGSFESLAGLIGEFVAT